MIKMKKECDLNMEVDLKSCIGKKVKDFVSTTIKNEFVIIFDDNTALWFHKKPYAIGSVREMERRDEKN